MVFLAGRGGVVSPQFRSEVAENGGGCFGGLLIGGQDPREVFDGVESAGAGFGFADDGLGDAEFGSEVALVQGGFNTQP